VATIPIGPGPVALRTARLHLRPIRADDADAWHDAVFADPDVMRSLPTGAPSPRGEMAARIERHLDHWQEHGFGLFAVTLRDDGSFLGHCGLRVVEEWPGDVEVLYAIARSRWGQGFASEAAVAAVRFGFEGVGLERVVGFAVPDNVASRGVLRRCGMTLRGATHLFDLDVVWYATESPPPGSAPFEIVPVP
jgi:ribosomal-protein-alanine N-acetyltransferase